MADMRVHARVVAVRAGARERSPGPLFSLEVTLSDGRKGVECVKQLWKVTDEVATFIRERRS